MNYGIPYMGSKAKICRKLVSIFPKATNFYDLFGGGFSVTHAMLVHRGKDFKRFHFNEIRPGISDLIKDSVGGKYSYNNFKPEFISRERFFKDKEINAYIKMVWSFGNNGEDYIFGKDIEAYKKSLHQAIVFNEFDEYAEHILGTNSFKDNFSIIDKRLILTNRLKVLMKDGVNLEKLEQLERLQQLERLEQPHHLQQLERLNFYTGSYDKIKIEKNSIVYCDIPYIGTEEYDKNKNFNRKAFLDWSHNQEEPVFISEYAIEDPRFKYILGLEKTSLMDSKTRTVKIEKVFANQAAQNILFNKIKS